MTSSPQQKAQAFLAISDQFKLGDLPTESRHPKTMQLSQLAECDPIQAIRLLQEIEFDALSGLSARLDELRDLADSVHDTLTNGRRVFLCGCGATGRLSLSLEVLWRAGLRERSYPHLPPDAIVSFIAGGDYALVRSIENFEDHPEYGARQLRELGFRDGDLLISCTEGGETPFVIGATEEAATISSRSPYFLFCNPSEILKQKVERSRRVLENPNINSICLETGPMAVAGSTRLQASTVLMLAVGAALMGGDIQEPIEDFKRLLKTTDLSVLAPLIVKESAIYAQGGYCLHRTTDYAITVLTDTTERAPTFSLVSFENPLIDLHAHSSWTYLVVKNTRDAMEAWRRILLRDPRPLDWPTFAERFGHRVLPGFDFSPATAEKRRQRIGPEIPLVDFDIDAKENEIALKIENLEARLPRPEWLLNEHLLLKCALNISSTLVMGRLGRFHGNLMHFVRSSNNKLIDRSIRCTKLLLEAEGITHFSYAEICSALFEVLENLEPGEAAVPRTTQLLKERQKSSKAV